MPPKGWSKKDAKQWEHVKAVQLLFSLSVLEAKKFIKIHGPPPYHTGLVPSMPDVAATMEVPPSYPYHYVAETTAAIAESEVLGIDGEDISKPFSLEELDADKPLDQNLLKKGAELVKAHRRWIRGKAHFERLDNLLKDLHDQRAQLVEAVAKAEDDRNAALSALTKQIEKQEGLED